MDMFRGKFLLFYLLFTTLAIRTWGVIYTLEPDAKDILSMVAGAATFEHLKSPIDCYRLYDAQGNPVGAAVITTHVPPHVGGYLDEIESLVGIDESGQITGVKLLAHQENQEYISKILSKGFLGLLLKRNPSERWDDIETITGATISADAIREDVRTASLAALKRVLKSGVLQTSKEVPKVISPLLNRQLADSAAIVLLSALSITAAYMPKRRFLRTTSLLLSFVVIGLLFNTPITIANFVDLGRRTLPSMTNLPLSILLIFAVATAFIKGPLYCNYLCPFGAMQVGAASLAVSKCRVDGKWISRASFFRWAVLIVAIVAIAIFNIGAFRKIEPFALCFSLYKDNPVWPEVGVILIIAVFFRRPWCRLFCPTGLALELISKIGGKVRLKFISAGRLSNVEDEKEES